MEPPLQSTLRVNITIDPINDKQHYLLLDGDNSSSAITVTFIEEGDPVLLSKNLRIDDEDVGEKFLHGAIVYIIDCELCISKLCTCNKHLVSHRLLYVCIVDSA